MHLTSRESLRSGVRYYLGKHFHLYLGDGRSYLSSVQTLQTHTPEDALAVDREDTESARAHAVRWGDSRRDSARAPLEETA